MGVGYSEAKKRLLDLYLRGELGFRQRAAQIPRRSPGERIPLSHSQEQVWVHAQLAPELPLYNEPVTIHYSGPLNVEALERSLNEILRRHEAWRTAFRVVDGEAIQEVLGSLSIALPLIDLTGLPREQREEVSLQIATADARKPIDLTNPPLFRAKLIRLDSEQHRLYLTLSHIIFDGVAIYRVFLPEISTLYKAFAAGEPSPLPELEIQYPDFACWERRNVTQERMAKEIEYWREQLTGDLPPVYLPADHSSGRLRSYQGSMYPFQLSRPLTSALRHFCRVEGVSMFHVLLAAFAALLQRYSGEERIPIGTVTAGRSRETENLLGYFLNTVVVPADVSENPSFRTLVHRARNWSLAVLDHDRVPFEYLVRELQAQREPNHNPLFQALFSLEPPMPEVDPNWQLTQMDVDTGATKYDLYLELDERSEQILARFHYCTDLFERQTIERMVLHWRSLLRDGMANPERRLSELSILSSRERRDLLRKWNRTAQDYSPTSVHNLIELQTQLAPGAVALVCDGKAYSYQELNEHANRLAHFLIQRGVGPEVTVGICLERGANMVIALLGILKAGGAYVPLDSRLPAERLAFMLADSNPALVLCDSSSYRPTFGKKAIAVDPDWNFVAHENSANPSSTTRPETLAYIMYTSGSTGKPKGVAVEHRSLINLLRSMQSEPGLSARDVLLAVTTLSFDIAGLEIFLPLISGARVVIAESEDVIDGNRLRELLENSGATMMQATPATWRLLIEAGWQAQRNLKILCGGEPLLPGLARHLTAHSDYVWNVYGPTETTIWSTLHRVTEIHEETVPIGRPLANTSILILDRYGNPVPINVAGEIYIGGEGLARGYVNRPELTAERFVTNWVAAEQSPRLYRTGDMGRYRSNGVIEYLGRVDSQIKLRGMRIELGEIESVLTSNGGVREAVVTVDGEAEQQKLSAYVVADEAGAALDAGELRRYLRSKLPEHMVPASYWQVERLPLLPSGKVNRGALSGSGGRALAEGQEWAGPQNETEVRLAEIWQELLKVEAVGREQNFFELGGHSLLVLQMTARIRRMLDVDLPVRAVFEAPTIAGLAREVEKAKALGSKTQASILQRRPGTPMDADQEALLIQLDHLTAEEARGILQAVLKANKSGNAQSNPVIESSTPS